ncbi:glycine-rich domain-containing protein [Gluconobacter cerinus]|uniref:glycine-rich domain-containing protein n=1 Tax=Gluconobacter cerinus TaxID=38307 RepID=UPI001B8D581F|nr:hypothetical protein [Gluconobacter cerinus]MBS1034982.1 hypothetical protein [Gluconobacter cerinus]
MPYDSNGNYTLPSVYKATPGTVIMTEQHNTPFEDVQAALNNVLLRDGSSPFLANINANSFRIIDLAAGVSGNDAVNVSQLNAGLKPLLSGTLGVITANKDQNGLGLHLNGSTSRASFIYASGSGDLAWYSDIASEAKARASADNTLSDAISSEASRAQEAEAAAVSGTLGVIPDNGDKQGLGLHYNGLTKYASFVYQGGNFDLASQSSLDAEVERAKEAEAEAVSGTLGVVAANKDEPVTGLHIDGATGRPSVVHTNGSGDVAWYSDVTDGDESLSDAINEEVERAKSVEATLISGTEGVIEASGDKEGTGLHLNGLTGNASFSYSGGNFDLASQESLAAEVERAEAAEATAVSATVGVIPINGDRRGTGLHYDGATGRPSFSYDGGSGDVAWYSDITNVPTLYTGSSVITVPNGATRALVKLIGGGGSGCSVRGSGLSDSVYGAGGASGGYVYFWISVSQGQVINLTVAAGAASPTNTVGGQTNGGDTIAWLGGNEIGRARGGTGGVWNSSSSSAGGTGGGVTTQNGATPIEYSNGSDGGDGQTGSTSIASVTGYGGAGVWGGGGRAGNGGGNDGSGFGAGGGAAYDTSYSNTFYKGGAGHNGCAVVEFK